MTQLAIIDSGGANISSLCFAIERLGVPSEVTTDPAKLRAATHVILPGVGNASDCMQRLQAADLVGVVRSLRQPLLGVCVGMQLLFEGSAEGDVTCLGLLPGRVERLSGDGDLPIPHMGWNQLELCAASPLFNGITTGDYVYFVHSYAAPVSDASLAITQYGQAFSAVVQRGNVYGAQFHPERSARIGARLLDNFLKLN
jgi:glutamine amidotransferase